MLRETPNTPAPKVAYEGTSAAFDLAATETVTINPGEFKNVPTGIRLCIPQDEPYYMQVHLRSSLGFKHGLRCHIGIIDAGYTGDFGVSVVNNTDKPYTIESGSYFAQVLVLEKPKFEFEELNAGEWVEFDESQKRGNNGFGSSGR